LCAPGDLVAKKGSTNSPREAASEILNLGGNPNARVADLAASERFFRRCKES